MEIQARAVTRVSKKGDEYTAIELTIGDYKKLVFLSAAELALLNLLK